MGTRGRSRGWLTVALLVAVTALLLVPPTTATPIPAAAPAPSFTAGTAQGPATAGHSAVPAGSTPAAGTAAGSDRGAIHSGAVFRASTGSGAAPSGPSAAAAKKGPGYSWGSAYVLYGPSDPQTLMFAEGTGLTTYNALDEFLFFGGLGSGGLSNVTWR